MDNNLLFFNEIQKIKDISKIDRNKIRSTLLDQDLNYNQYKSQYKNKLQKSKELREKEFNSSIQKIIKIFKIPIKNSIDLDFFKELIQFMINDNKELDSFDVLLKYHLLLKSDNFFYKKTTICNYFDCFYISKQQKYA